MDRLPACRVCLAYNTRLCSIPDGPLRYVYETLVEASLDTADMLPTSVCYLCFSSVKKVLQFRNRSQKANQILQQMISSGLEPSVSSLDMFVKDQTGISWTLGISRIERTTITPGEVEIEVKLETVKTEIDIDGTSDRNEDYSDSMPVYRDSTSDTEDDLPLQNLSEQWETDCVKVKIEDISDLSLETSSGHEGAASPEKRKLVKIESDNELVNIQAPFIKTEKDDETREQKGDKKKVSDLSNRNKTFKSSLETILKETEATTSNIISKKHNESALIKNDSVTPPKFIFTNEYQSKTFLEIDIEKSHVIELNRNANSINSELKVKTECNSTNVLEGQDLQNNDNLTETNKCRKEGKQYQCSYCMKCFTSNGSLSLHLRIHTKQNLYNCDICEKGFSRSNHLTEHLRVHTKEKPFKCDICEKRFSRNNHLTRHYRVHKEKPFKCDICEKGFSRSSNLTIHKKSHSIHSGEKPYSCSYCNKTFFQFCNLSTHLRVHTKEKPFKCDTCQKCFSLNSSLTKHLRIHSDEKPHSCSYCNKSFSQNASLTAHILRIHSGEKPYSCTYCNKLFYQLCNLSTHLRVHTKEKPFKCDTCEKCFSLNSSLTKHLRIHSGEKPYSCSYCNKSFTQNGSLTAHLRIHSGEKPYSCTYCKKSFSRNICLTAHLRIHTGEKPYSCSYCDKRFTARHNLKAHLRSHAEENNLNTSLPP